MAKKVIDPQPIIDKLAARCLESKGLECSALGSVIDMLKAAPRVDAVEVVHGKMRHMFYSYQNNHYECTCCDATFLTNSAPYWSYCPNCGAKMDGDGNA